MAPWRFGVLGPLQVLASDAPLPLGGPRQRAVLAMLLAQVDDVVSVTSIVDGVWGDDPPPTAERTLHAYIARLRSLIDAHSTGDGPQLSRARTGYVLRLDGHELDAIVFEREVTAARREIAAGDYEKATTRLRAALALWRGAAFADLTDSPGVAAAAARLDRLRVDALVLDADAQLAVGRHEILLPRLRDLVAEWSLDERLWAALALAYYRSGQQAEALDTITRARRLLVDELGIGLGVQLREMQAAILAEDPRLDLPSERADLVAAHPGLEGRKDALERFRAAWRRASAGQGGALTVTGTAGIGRSRVVQAFAAEVRASGGHVVVVRADDFGPSVQLLETVQAVGTGQTCLVVVDDAELATLAEWREWMRLVNGATTQPVLVVLALREEQLPPELSVILGQLDPKGTHGIRLEPLGPDDVARVARSYVGADRALEAANAIMQSSRGVPALVHAQLREWAFARVTAHVAARAGAAAAGWSEAHRGEAALVDGLVDVSRIESTAQAARALAAGPPPCPYPRLEPYAAEGAAFFAGREDLVALALARLTVARSLLLVGPSGVGKSSIVRAGMIPGLAAGLLPDSESWAVELLRPRDIAARVIGVGTAEVVVIDQFEEILQLGDAERAHASSLLHAFGDRGTYLVAVARLDKLPQLFADADTALVTEWPQLVVSPMDRRQLERAARVPVVRAGGSIDPAVTAAIVDELAGEAGALPLLSTAMAHMWELEPGGHLTETTYRSAGGVTDAVARLGEATYGRLSPAEQEAARSLLLRMATTDDTGHVVRRLLPRGELPVAGPARSAYDALVRGRLVVAGEDSATVAHEALFTAWPRLAEWLAADAEARAARTVLSNASRLWVDGGRRDEDLARGPRLAVAGELAQAEPDLFGPQELEFVRASEAARRAEVDALRAAARRTRRNNLRLRALLAVAVAALLTAVAAGVVDLHLRHEADAAATQATARGLGSEALTTGRLDLALLLAAQSAQMVPAPAERGDLLAVEERAPSAQSVRIPTGQRILQVALGGSPQIVVVVDRTGAVTMTDIRGRRLPVPAALRTGKPWVSNTAFSADGSKLLLAGTAPNGQAGRLLLLDVPSMRVAMSTSRLPAAVAAVAFGAGDRRPVVLTDDGVVHQLDLTAAGRIGPTRATGVAHPVALQLAAGGKLLVTNAPAQVWTTAPARPTSLPTGFFGALDRTGSTWAVGDDTGEVQLVDVATGRVLHRLAGQSAALQDIAFDDAGNRLATSADDGTTDVWDVGSGHLLESLTGHAGRVAALAFSHDGGTLATGGYDGRLVLWDLHHRPTLGRTVGSLATVPGAVALPDSYVATTGASGRILVGEPDGAVVVAGPSAAAGDVVAHRTAHHGPVNDAEVSADGHVGVTAGSDGTVRLWDLATGAAYGVRTTHAAAAVTAAALAGDHQQFAYADEAGHVTVARTGDGTTTRRWRLTDGGGRPAGVVLLSFAPDGRHVAAAVLGSGVRLLPLSGSGPSTLLGEAASISALTFSPDSRLLVTAAADGSVRMWDTATHRFRDLGPDESASTAYIDGAAFDPTGRTLATWALDGSLQLWDAQSAAAIGPPVTAPIDGGAMAAAWRDSSTLDVVHADGQIVRLTISQPALVRHACAVAQRRLTRREWAHYLPGRPYAPVC